MDHDGHDEEPAGPAGDGQQAGGDGGSPPAIDIEALAAKVRQLMIDELRLEKARGAAVGRTARNW
jgi:hypothetical protein